MMLQIENYVNKIVIINKEFFREDLGGFGGYGHLVKYLAEHYNVKTTTPQKPRKRGIEIDVILTITHKDEALTAHNAKVFPIAAKEIGTLSRTLLTNPRAIAKFLKKVREVMRNACCALSIEWYYPYALPAIATPRDVPFIVWLQDPRSEKEWKKIATSKFILSRELHEKNYKRALRKLRVSEKIASKLLKFVEKVRLQEFKFATQAKHLRMRAYLKYNIKDALDAEFLPNPINIPHRNEIKVLARKFNNETADKYGINPEAKKILYLGRLDPIKRPWLFFECAKLLPKYEFIVAGVSHDKEMNHIIEKYTNIENLHFIGLVTGEMKKELLAASDVLVNTSIHEALPVSFLEAFAYKTPVVSTQNPDCLVSEYGAYTGEILGDGYEKTQIIANNISEIVEDESLQKHLGKKARNYVEKNHTFSKFEKQLEKITKS